MSAKTPTINKKLRPRASAERVHRPIAGEAERDNGYWSGDNLQALEQSGTDAYIATEKVKRPTKYRWIARIANWSRPTSTT